MPAQAIEMLRIRTSGPKIKTEKASDLASDAYAPLDKPRWRPAHSDDLDASPGHHSHRCLHTRPLRGGRIRPRHRAPHSPPLGGERDHAPHMAHTPTESHHRYVRVQDAATKEEQCRPRESRTSTRPRRHEPAAALHDRLPVRPRRRPRADGRGEPGARRGLAPARLRDRRGARSLRRRGGPSSRHPLPANRPPRVRRRSRRRVREPRSRASSAARPGRLGHVGQAPPGGG